MPTIALFGAAGAIGNSISAALRNRGTAYRVVGRGRAQLEKQFGSDPFAEIVTWNPDDPASVRAASRGIETLVYLVGVPYDHFELHPALMAKTLEGAIGENVRRILLIGTVYPYGRPRTREVSEDHPREPHTFKGKKRKAQEDLLLQAHSDGKIEGTILRLPDFYGPGVDKSFLHGIFQAAVSGGRANVIGPIDRPHEFMFVPDVGPVALALADKPEAYGKWWNFAGPGNITQREIINRVFAMAGHAPKLFVAGKTTLRIAGLFQPLMRELVEMNYLMTEPVLMNDSALHRLLGEVNKTSYEDGLRITFEAYRNAPKASH